MPEISVIIVLAVVLALAFDYINGFHDTANAIATVVLTRVLTPLTAIVMATVLNFAGAMLFTKVAKTVASGIIPATHASETIVLAALIGAIVWNLVTWFYGFPSSSSHALIGGLVGAALASGGIAAVTWSGLLGKVIYPLFTSPIVGFIFGFALMAAIARFFAHHKPATMSSVFRKMQILSSAIMAFAHGNNDAQKSMGVITMALFSAGAIREPEVPLWVKLACASAMGLGTAAGGWRIIKTVGRKFSHLQPVHGFAAETSSAAVILTASSLGMPISTTHAISSSIMGVGASKRLSAVRWQVARNVVTAWFLTIPVTMALGALSYLCLSLFLR